MKKPLGHVANTIDFFARAKLGFCLDRGFEHETKVFVCRQVYVLEWSVK